MSGIFCNKHCMKYKPKHVEFTDFQKKKNSHKQQNNPTSFVIYKIFETFALCQTKLHHTTLWFHHCHIWFYLIKIDRNVKISTCVLSPYWKCLVSIRSSAIQQWWRTFDIRNLFPRFLIWFWWTLQIDVLLKWRLFWDIRHLVGWLQF